MKAVLLSGARDNCGDYLIADRARRLFARHLPGVEIAVLDRTRPFSEEAFREMETADLVVLAGGPLVRGNCAEALNLAGAALSGRLAAMRAAFVVMGGGGETAGAVFPGARKSDGSDTAAVRENRIFAVFLGDEGF